MSVCSFSQEPTAKELTPEQKQIALLQELGKRMIISDEYEDRRNANYAFIKQLTKLLNRKNSFEISLEQLRFLSVQTPKDEAFRIITWQIETVPGLVRHYGAIQLNQKDLKLIPLTDRSEEMEYPELSIGGSRNWFGAIYYHVQAVKRKAGTQYYLYGYDSHNPVSNIKVVDVLQFSPNGDAVFGLSVFPDLKRPGQTTNRFLLEFREDAGVRLNYSSRYKKIIFDHLVPINEASEGIFADYVPDGTFDALVMKNGAFVLETDVVVTTGVTPENTNTRPKSDTLYNSRAKE